MWTTENRPRCNCDKLRYPSDLTDVEWALVAPLIPPAKRGGRKQSVDVREVVNGLMYVLSTRCNAVRCQLGCQWRYVPNDLPPRSTLFSDFGPWTWASVIDRVHHALYAQCRGMLERKGSPTACIVTRRRVPDIDSQGVKPNPPCAHLPATRLHPAHGAKLCKINFVDGHQETSKPTNWVIEPLSMVRTAGDGARVAASWKTCASAAITRCPHLQASTAESASPPGPGAGLLKERSRGRAETAASLATSKQPSRLRQPFFMPHGHAARLEAWPLRMGFRVDAEAAARRLRYRVEPRPARPAPVSAKLAD